MTKTVGSLEDRFIRFVGTLPGAEAIDELTLPVNPETGRRADFLLEQRRVIVELKTLVVDPSHKIETEVGKHRSSDEFPLFYGAMDLQKVLSHLPDGTAVRRRIYGAITRSVEDAVRAAEEQISDTRDLLRIPGAAGVLVILNESLNVLDPNVVGHKVASLLRRNRTGRSSVAKLNFVWLLFESHTVAGPAALPAFPNILILGDAEERFPWFSAYHSRLVESWAAFNNGVALDGGSPDPETVRFRPTQDLRAEQSPAQVVQHELWRREYDANPYLRGMTDAAVLDHGRAVLERLTPYFRKGGLGFQREVVTPLLREFTCFLQEANNRGLDMRRMAEL